jgi:hypothetical protein
MNRFHQYIDGTVKQVDVEFRCQTCGHLFVDAERMLCEAPPVGQTLASQKVRALYEAKQSGEYLSPKDVKLLKAVETLTGESKLSKEQREELEAKLDVMLRSAWADAMFAHRDSRGPDPGSCDAFVSEKKKEFRITDEGQIEQIKQVEPTQ